MAPVVRQCCCGCTLLTGTRIIAVVLIIGYAYNIGSGFLNLSSYDKFIGSAAETWVYVSVAICSIMLVVNICLYIATYNENSFLVMLWIGSTITMLFYSLGSNIYLGVELGETNFDDADTQALRTGIIGGIVLGCALNILLTIYFIIVVWSWHEEVKEGFQNLQNVPVGGPNITVVTSNTATFGQQPGYMQQPAGYAPYPTGYAQPGAGYGPPPYGTGKDGSHPM